MIHVEKSIVINKPVEQVYAVITDGSQAPHWQSGLDAVEGRTDTVGSQYTEIRSVSSVGNWSLFMSRLLARCKPTRRAAAFSPAMIETHQAAIKACRIKAKED